MTITLATLAQATAQEVFDQVAVHLLKQYRRSIDEKGNCFYRSVSYGGKTLMCAAGCLIADHEYRPEMDSGGGTGTTWHALVRRQLVPVHATEMLIAELQRVHD